MTLPLANHASSLPVAYRLYLPKEWTDDQARRKKAHVPDDVRFKTKPQIALDQIAAALASGAPKAIVLAGAAYGCNGPFRAALTRMGLTYCVGVPSNTSVWPPGAEPLPAKARRGRGRKPSAAQHDGEHKPVLVKALAMKLPADAWSEVTWREGSNTPLASRFAAIPGVKFCACVRRRAAIKAAARRRMNGCSWRLVESWNGPKAKNSPPNTGFRHAPKTRRWPGGSSQTALAHRTQL